MQLFSADPKNMKKTPSKVSHNRSQLFNVLIGPAAQTHYVLKWVLRGHFIGIKMPQ